MDANPTKIWIEKLVSYPSRSFTPAERNYSQLDREGTAIYWSVRKFFRYLYKRKFEPFTDNNQLSRIFKQDTQMPLITALRLLRYAEFLSGFQYEILHKKSEAHKNADYVSSAPLQEITNDDCENKIYIQSVD